MNENRRRDRYRWALVLVLLAAWALRLHQLGAQSLWYDETVSVFLAGKTPAQLIAHTAGDIHPPGYYLMLRGWLLLTGYPMGHADASGHGLEFSAALLSTALGLVIIAQLYRLGRRLYGDAVALLGAALASISPFHIWYGQEVRMYTLGAALGLVCLSAALRLVGTTARGMRLRMFMRSRGMQHSDAILAVLSYVLAATAGLYFLYYFAFLLVALNAWVLTELLRRTAEPRQERVVQEGHGGGARPWTERPRLTGTLMWMGAQLAVLLLYLPWLPVAWRQATNPPVPPWRTATPLWSMVTETWSALSFGQSFNLARMWPLLVVTALLFVGGALVRGRPWTKRLGSPALPLLAHTLAPMVLIWLASLWVPLFHVRYAFTYAPPFVLLLAAGIVWLARRRALGRFLAAAAVTAILMGSATALDSLWTDPAYAADDHRGAVRFLDEQARPGDAVLVNAGYAYTALMTYLQQPVAWRGRLDEYDTSNSAQSGLVVVQTGHIDGDPDIGWGDPASDFYALPLTTAGSELAALFAAHARVWHYRIYDTVNDPSGEIRALLAAYGRPFADELFSGEANLQVQGYLSRELSGQPVRSAPAATFGDDLVLHPADWSREVNAGGTFHIPVEWQVIRQPSADYATSVRLIGEAGRVWSQPPDEHPLGPLYQTSQWEAGLGIPQTLRLPVPADTPPGAYTVELVVYDPSGDRMPGVRLSPGESGFAVVDASRLRLGRVSVRGPEQPLSTSRPLARFDYLLLLSAHTPALSVSPGDSVPLDSRWVPKPSEYVDDYVLILELLSEGGEVVASDTGWPVDGRYPTSLWPTGYPVRDKRELRIPVDVPPGRYTLAVGLQRALDGKRIPAHHGFLGLVVDDSVGVQAIEVRR